MNAEQRDQLLQLMEALKRDFYHPVGKLTLTGFKSGKKLLLNEAVQEPRIPFPEGYLWGDRWEYAWMFASFALPEHVKGERIVMDLNPGGESTIFINGSAFGTCRNGFLFHRHHFISDQILTDCASGTETYELAMEVYGGTPLPLSPRGRCATGPVFPEEGVLEETLPPARVGSCTFGIWNEEAYQLWLDLTTLYDLYETEQEDSFLKEKIGCLLGELLDRIDVEVPLPARRAAYTKGRELLLPALQAKNGTFAASMGVIGNSHLDVAWLWPLAETQRKTIRTISQQLRLLEEYPEARFLQSQCVLYDMCQQQYPELFEKIKQAIARGQWVAEGAMWVEPDTNLAGGEALIRQFLYGKDYFRKELDTDSKIAWLPDTFGYSAVLPQILAGCEVEGLTTQKIFWTYNDAEPFPHHAFLWKGLDGTSIPCYLHMFYESAVDVKTLHKRWHDRLCKDGTGEFYLPFGYGDGGGGPTRDDFEFIRRANDLQGVPKLHYETPQELFERCRMQTLPVYRGELYFQCHRGTYTTQAAVKKGNRKAEQLMRACELWNSCAAWSDLLEYPSETIEQTWKKVLLNQFHDIIPGSSIGRVYTEALELYEELYETAETELQKALALLSAERTADRSKTPSASASASVSVSASVFASVSASASDCEQNQKTTAANAVTIYHDQSFEQKRLVQLDASFAGGAVTAEGDAVPCMKTPEGALALVCLPSMGSVSLMPVQPDSNGENFETDAAGSANICTGPVTAQTCEYGYLLENECVRAIFSHEGQLIRLTDLKSGRERIGTASNCLHLYRDLPRAFDAWDIDSQTQNREIPLDAVWESCISCAAGLRASIVFKTSFGQSQLTQTVSLDTESCRIDFQTRVDWHERHKLLKVSFDTGIDAAEAANQIQFGYIMRPTHKSHTFDGDRFEVCNHGYTALFDATHGAALLNDCKYGVSMTDSTISLSLLRGATNPDPQADQGEHTFCYSYYFWDGSLDQSRLVQEVSVLNAPVHTVSGLSPRRSWFQLDRAQVLIESVKLAEDGSGDMILRLYESMNGTRNVTFSCAFDISSAAECNMLEKPLRELPTADRTISLSFRPFEIKTLRLRK